MEQWVIATDEAGYGPTLGPLTIAASAWRVTTGDANSDLRKAFEHLEHPILFSDSPGDVVRIHDSKSVYQSGQHAAAGMRRLHAVADGVVQCQGAHRSPQSLANFVRWLAPSDAAALEDKPWYQGSSSIPWQKESWQSGEKLAPVLKHPSASCIATSARVIDAQRFNASCDRYGNKAAVLSLFTLRLARDLLKNVREEFKPDCSQVAIYCDRHGGRKRYAAVLHEAFQDLDRLNTREESSNSSRYQFSHQGQTVDCSFDVKGDRFPPVGLSSIIAKYTRERMMDCWNDYFANLPGAPSGLVPTAGYPQDAARYLRDIESTLKKNGIPLQQIVRCR